MSVSPPTTTYAASETIRRERILAAGRVADYLELVKPRIAAMVLLTVTMGYTLGITGSWQFAVLLNTVAGVGLVAAAAGALNQWIERRTDARMNRTANRPLPTGRLQPFEVAAFGIVCGISGTAFLAITVNVLTAALTLLTLVLYVAAYTPLKRYSALATVVGAIPGALPPVLGWTASGGELGWPAFSLFAVLFVWQFPHFLAIAWLYRRDYAAAGLRMLPGGMPARGLTGLLACAYAAALIPVSLLPAQFALAGSPYRIAALVLGFGYLAAAIRFLIDESPRTARGLLLMSLVYLPVLFAVLTWDHLRLSL